MQVGITQERTRQDSTYKFSLYRHQRMHQHHNIHWLMTDEVVNQEREQALAWSTLLSFFCNPALPLLQRSAQNTSGPVTFGCGEEEGGALEKTTVVAVAF